MSVPVTPKTRVGPAISHGKSSVQINRNRTIALPRQVGAFHNIYIRTQVGTGVAAYMALLIPAHLDTVAILVCLANDGHMKQKKR